MEMSQEKEVKYTDPNFQEAVQLCDCIQVTVAPIFSQVPR